MLAKNISTFWLKKESSIARRLRAIAIWLARLGWPPSSCLDCASIVVLGFDMCYLSSLYRATACEPCERILWEYTSLWHCLSIGLRSACWWEDRGFAEAT